MTTISALKALIAADNNCNVNTTTCQYNQMPFHDFRLEGVYVMSNQHSDFDNNGPRDAGAPAQPALYLADHPTAAPNEGIELVAPYYFTLPAVQQGGIVNVEGSLRVNFGNTYFRVLRIFNETDGGLYTITPVTVDPTLVANTQVGGEGRGTGGCTRTNSENSQTGEPYEGALVDVTLPAAGASIFYRGDTDGGLVHRFTLDNDIMVADNFGVLGQMQGDGGIALNAGMKVTKLRGFSYYSFGCRKIQPRSVDDITITP